eukprot:1160393-Pelagomonas_calceolata.AAC.11
MNTSPTNSARVLISCIGSASTPNINWEKGDSLAQKSRYLLNQKERRRTTCEAQRGFLANLDSNSRLRMLQLSLPACPVGTSLETKLALFAPQEDD